MHTVAPSLASARRSLRRRKLRDSLSRGQPPSHGRTRRHLLLPNESDQFAARQSVGWEQCACRDAVYPAQLAQAKHANAAAQIYFRKLGGASVDTPDLGPVTKLGMGRKTGEVVREPKAAAALPDMGGSDALALEFGAGAPAAAAAPSDNSASVTDASGTGARQADAAPDLAQVAPAEAAEDDGDIVGGLVVSEADMQGVAAAELEYLQRRCKRRRADARQVSAA